jgi:tripartite-type tricarboxylate transporter receptor subunit TctC
MQLPRRQFLRLTASAFGLSAFPVFANAESYPGRPVRIIVPLAAGGGLDFVSRLTGEYLSRSMGQQFVIENKAGAGGMLGIETAARSQPDGYTVLNSTDAIASAPSVTKFNVDFISSLVPVALLTRSPQIIAVHPSIEVKSLPDLIRYAKGKSGSGYATSGAGTNQHFLGEWVAREAGLKLVHVPYRGAGQAVNDLVAGHILIAVLGPAAIIPFHQAGTLRIIAQSSLVRSPSLPDVPTIEEGGLKGVVLDTWQGMFVPEKTPTEIIRQLSSEIGKAMSDPMLADKLRQGAQEAVGASAEQLALLLKGDTEKYARLVQELKIKLD